MFARVIARSLFTLSLFACAAMAADTNSPTIKKCKDATGKWHYGDTAAEECAKSKVEVLSEEGVKKREIAAPPTEAELAERAKNREEDERKQAVIADQAKRDQILLQSYPHEDDLVLYRDRKLSQLDATLKSSEETLRSIQKVADRLEAQRKDDEAKGDKKALASTEKSIAQTKSQIEKHQAAIQATKRDQELVRKQFDSDLVRYRELKQPSASATAKKN
jgi:hypothetical protein